MRWKVIVAATLIAGTLDIVSAAILTVLRGRPVGAMLRTVASGPLGQWPLDKGSFGAFAGLATHYALMAAMVVIFAAACSRLPIIARRPLVSGATYGLMIYLVMYWIVMPLRWPAAARPIELSTVAVPIAIHVLLVGVPIAFTITRLGLARRRYESVGRG